MRRRTVWHCCPTSLVACPLDNVLHALRIHWDWLCDRHEARIPG